MSQYWARLLRQGCWLLLAVPCLHQGMAAAEEPPVPAHIRFNDDIRPILNRACIACHGGLKQAGDVSFVYPEKVLPPDGWIISPGHPEDSSLIERVTSTDPEQRMPPPDHGNALSKHEIELLREWIRQGAKWEGHWAYLPPRDAAIPAVRQQDWCRDPVDRFILARLEQAGIAPSAEAAPERWLRRVSLDLTGLPPALEDRTEFLADLQQHPDTAYETVVDRLLASPDFGERWASVWLDQLRYADSKGLGLDGRRNIWKYRDWVIQALNQDLPYDQFTIKQLAGDLLPDHGVEDVIATAAQRLTQSNEEGGTDDEEFRIAAVLDRVNTTWQAWQGVTFGCVQCHSHPYDPFTHEEYYRFAAFFNNTADCDLDEEWPVVQAPVDPADDATVDRLDRQIGDLRNEIWQKEMALLTADACWQPLHGMSARSSNATQLVVEQQGDHEEFHTQGTVSRNTDITLEAPLPEDLHTLTAIRFTALPLHPEQARVDTEWGFVLSHVTAQLMLPGQDSPRPVELSRLIIDEPEPFMNPQESLNPKSKQGFSAYSRISTPRQAALLLKTPVQIPPGTRLQVTLQHRVYLLSAFSLITRRGHLAVSNDDRFQHIQTDPDIQALQRQQAELERQRKKIPSTSVPVLKELPEPFARPTHVFIRGLFLTKDKAVTAGTPASLPPLPEDLPPNRLALAHWMVSPQNPLTARVAVNRFWARLFGIGLVATEEDFGSSGDSPSHPRLLDYLALRFQHSQGWSVKQLLRELVLCSTYRQQSQIRTDLQERDSQNRLLARGPRQRLSAEMLRDQALAVSGLLSRKRFGPPVYPPIPNGVWQPFIASDKWIIPPYGSEDRYRRSIYTYTKRSIPYPLFAAFDAPSREFCTPRRLLSNTPVQALMTLNDASFQECFQALAARMKSSGDHPRQQLRFGFLLVTCREPSPAELEDLMGLYDSLQAREPSDRLTNVAGVLLNLDEAVTR